MPVSLSTILTSLLLVASGVAGGKMVTAFARRRVTRADAAETLGDAASKLGALSLEQATAAHAEAVAARMESAQARRDVFELQIQVGRLNSEVELLLGRLRSWRLEILRPGTTVDTLRALVGNDPVVNGRG